LHANPQQPAELPSFVVATLSYANTSEKPAGGSSVANLIEQPDNATFLRKVGTNLYLTIMKVPIWVLALASGIVCGSALFIATFGNASGARPQQVESQPAQALPVAEQNQAGIQTYEGMITDTHCGAKHSADISRTASDCTRVCVHAGERFALVDGDKMYILEGDPGALKRAAGERVKVTGRLNGDTISVASVASGAPRA
jgi:hypothetical protein